MNKIRMLALFIVFSFSCIFADQLPSWNEGKAKKAILDFVKDVTDEKSKNYIPPEERIAVFDQDGTLWTEQPVYFQLFYAVDRINALAADNEQWKFEKPFSSILNKDLNAINQFTAQDIEKIVAVTHSGMSVHQYHQLVRDWLAKAVHPRFKKPFTQLIFQPMLEVIDLLKQNGFTNYIVSGGGQEFIRVYAEPVYGITTEHIIGSTGKVKYEYNEGKPLLLKTPEVLFIDDKKGKPEAINLFIGRRPVAAFGNSTGDREMLEWTNAGEKRNFELLVHHDDGVREYAYGADSKIGYFPDSLMDEALDKGWIVVSMKNDWKVIYPWEKSK